MKFKVGDKVKFLNENGGGVISKIISPGLVNVAIEDGFEIPILTSEILKIELDAPIDSPKHLFTEDFNVKVDQTPETHYESDERNIPLLSNSAKGNLEQGIYLAFVPHDQKWLITGMIDIYLANHTNYDILYSYFLEKEKGGFVGKDYGSATAESMVLLSTVDREEIEKWTKGVVQVLFHSDKSEGVLSPGNSNFKVKPTRFYQENSYKDSALINGKAIINSLIPLSAQTSLFSNEVIEKDEPAELIVREAKEVKPEHIIDKHKTSPREAVVDLHIYELIDDSENIDDSQKLRTQINYFTRCLESGIANNLYKVTFIHGVGTGVLKTTIKEILKDYPNVEIRDASMKQFGYGATEVVIRNK
ncbi:MAG: DUF2027 domain-containing protein [Bacteroidales bacterium]|nr:DUF2027 domain-containing protein [Bacteroidales bacterium]